MFKPANPLEIEQARRLWSEGYQVGEIARRVGLSKSTVCKYCSGITPPIRHGHPKRRIRAGEFYPCLDTDFDQ